MAGVAEKCEVKISYDIDVTEHVSVHVEIFGTEHQEPDFIEKYILHNYDLPSTGIIDYRD